MTDDYKPPLKLGSAVKPYGKVGSVLCGLRVGERYYILLDKHKSVALMPATLIEPMYEQQHRRRKDAKE